jgi:hypothetical protein
MSANTRVLIIALGLLVVMASGCRDVAEPESAETAAYLSGGDTSGEHQKRMAEVLAAYGIDIDESGGIFGIGWRNRSRPDDVDSDPQGRGRAIAFGEELEDGRRPGIDMGTVTLSYPDDQIELTKRERPVRVRCRRLGCVRGGQAIRDGSVRADGHYESLTR